MNASVVFVVVSFFWNDLKIGVSIYMSKLSTAMEKFDSFESISKGNPLFSVPVKKKAFTFVTVYNTVKKTIAEKIMKTGKMQDRIVPEQGFDLICILHDSSGD